MNRWKIYFSHWQNEFTQTWGNFTDEGRSGSNWCKDRLGELEGSKGLDDFRNVSKNQRVSEKMIDIFILVFLSVRGMLFFRLTPRDV